MPYLTILKEASAEFEEKKSVFIGHVKRVFNEDEAKKFIGEVKHKHKEARHNVYGYIIGKNQGIQRYSDDGEPQGTGGIPVLETLKKNGITDVVVVVTRYFGGILLGTGGLSRAYGKAASLAIKDAGVVERVRGCEIEAAINYDLLGKVQYQSNEKEYNLIETEYTDKVTIKFYIELEKVDALQNDLKEVTNGSVDLRIVDEKDFFKIHNKLFLI